MSMGYIKLYRKIMDTSFYKNPNCCHLAQHLLLKANHREEKIIFNKQELTIKKGQIVTGRETLARDTGMTSRNVRTCLKILENVGFLTSKPTNRFTLITVLNYNKYQENDQQSDQQVTSKRPAEVFKSDHKQDVRPDKHDKKTSTSGAISKKKQNFKIEIPGNLKTIWIDWLKYKAGRKQSLSAITIRKQLEFLKVQPNPVAVIDQSIRNNWQGLFPIKAEIKPRPSNQPEVIPDKYKNFGG